MEAEISVLPLPPRLKRLPTGCPASMRFAAWVEAQLQTLTAGEEQPSAVAVHRVVVRLTWQFFFERKGAEPAHRDRVAEENGERCVYGLFLDALERLHELHMAAEKLELVEHVPAPPRRSSKQERTAARIKTIAELLGES